MNGYTVQTSVICADGLRDAEIDAVEVHEFFDTLQEAMSFIATFEDTGLPFGVTLHEITLCSVLGAWKKQGPPKYVMAPNGEGDS